MQFIVNYFITIKQNVSLKSSIKDIHQINV